MVEFLTIIGSFSIAFLIPTLLVSIIVLFVLSLKKKK